MIGKYEITSIDNIVCLPGEGVYRAVVMVDVDLTPLMPFINGSVKGSKYMPGLHWIRFPFSGHPARHKNTWQVAVRGREILVAKFTERSEAAEIVGELIGYLNAVEKNKATIHPCDKAWAPPKVMDLLRLLPGTNCVECGCPSCMAFAAQLVSGLAAVDACPGRRESSPERTKLVKLLGT